MGALLIYLGMRFFNLTVSIVVHTAFITYTFDLYAQLATMSEINYELKNKEFLHLLVKKNLQMSCTKKY